MEEAESNDLANSEVKLKKESEICDKCLELQEKLTKSNDKCEHLELDIVKKIYVIECLEDEVRVLKQRNEDLEKSIRNVGDGDDDKITQLMIENNVLDCEKNKAESEIEAWKAKCRELEMRVIDLEQRVRAEMTKVPSDSMPGFNAVIEPSGTPPMNTPQEDYSDVNRGRKRDLKLRGVRKCLDFDAVKNISHLTLDGRPPCQPITIDDSDDNLKNPSIPKRRKVISESGSENDDDDIPIGRLPRRRRLVKAGDREDKGSLRNSSNKIIETVNSDVSEDEIEEYDDSSSEGESLGGFIVSSSGSDDSVSENHDTLSVDGSGDSEHASESSMEFDEVISSLRRDRKNKKKWEYEADMLADFGKSPELCMRAVCALYRQQTAEEQSSKATIVLNGRGFNHIHAYRGTQLAEFLNGGDPHSDITKSVDKLQEFDSKGVEQCRKLATHYSKQLFEIYKNQEDPFFHP